MRIVVQRATSASVSVEGELIASIGAGLVALVGVASGDSDAVAGQAAKKLGELRIFADEHGKMNRSLLDSGGSALVISQFTLLGDASRGRRPSFLAAAGGSEAAPIVAAVASHMRGAGVTVQEGRFGANMQVSLVNDGPVTLVLEL